MNAQQAKALAMRKAEAIVKKERAQVDAAIQLAAEDGDMSIKHHSHLSSCTIASLRSDGYYAEEQIVEKMGGNVRHYIISWA